MKHSAIAGLFITAALLASPVFAADEDLCDGNIQKLQDAIATAPATSENAMDNAKAALKKAQEAKAAGNTKDCIDITTGTLTKIQTRTPDKG
ncbi:MULTISPECIES: hypothetical protein [unclassified Pseudomonas]|uniref:hypothetical protein n=1 Tax=unclassified Pseudomonas TaxID=196821 RepID=UPI000BA308E8|nr:MULTISPECIES: hypothetical protein [unclassified Pseudomonas]MDX9666788.1 hypothetical protein [Pseudomonas sp. P5_152]QHC99501.1 hypothetical protein PspS04_03625 [Pseudomonas sp. S04]QHF31985.1 hypothetical protein PspS19_03625 [Pseudomonas sp. S19]